MTCLNCHREVNEGDRFCPWCGQPQDAQAQPRSPEPDVVHPAGTTPEPPGAAPEERELRELRSDIDAVTTEVARLSLRLTNLERQRDTLQARERGQRPAAPPASAPGPEQAVGQPGAGGNSGTCRGPGTWAACASREGRMFIRGQDRLMRPWAGRTRVHAAASGRRQALLPAGAAPVSRLCRRCPRRTSQAGTGSGCWAATGWPASGQWR